MQGLSGCRRRRRRKGLRRTKAAGLAAPHRGLGAEKGGGGLRVKDTSGKAASHAAHFCRLFPSCALFTCSISASNSHCSLNTARCKVLTPRNAVASWRRMRCNALHATGLLGTRAPQKTPNEGPAGPLRTFARGSAPPYLHTMSVHAFARSEMGSRCMCSARCVFANLCCAHMHRAAGEFAQMLPGWGCLCAHPVPIWH